MKIAALILASGKGTRMNDGQPSGIPKTLHKLNGKPMLGYIYELLKDSGIDDIFVVIGYKADLIKEYLGDKAKYILQKNMLGTGEALQVSVDRLSKYEKIFVINGDSPFFTTKTVKEMTYLDADIVIASSLIDEPTGYGRLIKDHERVLDIIEEKDATEEQKKIKEINAGCYVFKTLWLKDALKELTLSASGEYYITELPKIASRKGLLTNSYLLSDPKEAYGVNTKEELVKAHKL